MNLCFLFRKLTCQLLIPTLEINITSNERKFQLPILIQSWVFFQDDYWLSPSTPQLVDWIKLDLLESTHSSTPLNTTLGGPLLSLDMNKTNGRWSIQPFLVSNTTFDNQPFKHPLSLVTNMTSEGEHIMSDHSIVLETCIFSTITSALNKYSKLKSRLSSYVFLRHDSGHSVVAQWIRLRSAECPRIRQSKVRN